MDIPQYKVQYPSPIGSLTLIASENALVGLYMEGQQHFDPVPVENLPAKPEHPVLQQTILWLDAYFTKAVPLPSLPPIVLRGTNHQQRVWQQLRLIPYGKTITYGELAKLMGSSPRAIGGAVGRNPVSILLPCHRVVGAGGKLTGYAGGAERKLWLLRHEQESSAAFLSLED